MPAGNHLRSLLLALAALLVQSCTTEPAPPLEWTTWRSADDGFEIAIPEGHQSTRDLQPHAFGRHPGHIVHWRRPSLAVTDLGLKLVSAGYYDLSDIDLRLDAAFVLDSFVREEARLGGTFSTGRIIEFAADSIQGYPARRIRSFVDNGKSDSLYLFEQFVLRDGRMYHLRLNGYKGVLDTGTMNLVRRSFRLIARA